MARLLAVTFALIPLAIAPGLFFYFDVTPKTFLALLAAAAGLIWWAAEGAPSGFYRSSREARWFVWAVCGTAVSLLISTLASVNPALSLGGSTWRFWGLVPQLAVLALVYLTAECCAGKPERVRVILRGCSAAGLLTAVYGIAQYFGWDPLQPSQTYHAGEGIFTIVRPPSTLGHADYLANWLLFVVFASAALAFTEKDRTWLWLSRCAEAAAVAAIILSGTRAALLGLLAGAVVLLWWRGLRFTWRAVAMTGIAVVAAAGFYFSPAGARMRARVHWALEERTGGARFLLWRDSLHMAAARWPLGYGPETFTGSFVRYQSTDLANAYPDFYHESPHNIVLDALVTQGAAGLAAFLALCAVGGGAALAVRREPPSGARRDIGGALAASLAAMAMSGQFVCFMLPTALPFFVTIALLVSLVCCPALDLTTAPSRSRLRITASEPRALASGSRNAWRRRALAMAPCAAVLALFALRLFVAETALALVRRDLDAGLPGDAADAYARYEAWRWRGASADLWYSRRLVMLAQSKAEPAIRVQAIQQAGIAAQRATETVEDPFNAYYNLAAFSARQNDFPRTEQSLRTAIKQAPNWFKPHWMLAQVLEAAGRLQEAEAEAARAVTLDGSKHPEVSSTLGHIRAGLGAALIEPTHK